MFASDNPLRHFFIMIETSVSKLVIEWALNKSKLPPEGLPMNSIVR